MDLLSGIAPHNTTPSNTLPTHTTGNTLPPLRKGRTAFCSAVGSRERARSQAVILNQPWNTRTGAKPGCHSQPAMEHANGREARPMLSTSERTCEQAHSAKEVSPLNQRRNPRTRERTRLNSASKRDVPVLRMTPYRPEVTLAWLRRNRFSAVSGAKAVPALALRRFSKNRLVNRPA